MNTKTLGFGCLLAVVAATTSFECLAQSENRTTGTTSPPPSFFPPRTKAVQPGEPALTREEAQARIEANRKAIQEREQQRKEASPPQLFRDGALAAEQKIFDLDFRGGTPAELVEAIEKATKEPLNAIIRDEDRNVMLPPLKVREVTVEDLFAALEQASRETKAQVTGTYYSDFGGRGARSQYAMVNTSFGFKKQGNLWVFRHEKPVTVPDGAQTHTVTRFYNLEPYLTKHTIEDLTTAIQTAWKMTADRSAVSGAVSRSDLKFHAETQLLIAVGDETQVQMIEDVLKALRPDLGSAQIKPKAQGEANTNAPTATIKPARR